MRDDTNSYQITLNNIETINILRLIRSENIGPKTFFSLIKLFGDAATAIDNAPDFSFARQKVKTN
ncbi:MULTISPECIES: DNA processing protein DprA [spotted fever group]|uniref:DNA processing protein DprA n=1 Tax=spotted fever group TaxID=114277 RepID=UPI0002FB9507|nr:MULTISPECIES: DNA processing protein DprA [spotted fever group]